MQRKIAIQIIERATDKGAGFDDWWADMMDDFGLYDEGNDTFPSLFDVLSTFGVTREEYDEAFKI